MATLLQTRVKKLEATNLSSNRLKEHIIDMLQLSTQCRAILECVNDETGEYRIVLEGVIEDERRLGDL